MKKLLIVLLFFSACSTQDKNPDTDKQKWIDSVYNQGWYWPNNGGTASDTPVPFTSEGSFIAGFTPWFGRDDLPKQGVRYILDEAVWDDSYAYYSFNYRFNGENLTLYYRIFHAHLNTTGEPGLFWAMTYSDDAPPLELSEQKAWLLKTFAKGNFFHSGYTLGLKKRGRATMSENSAPRDFNAPRSKDSDSQTTDKK